MGFKNRTNDPADEIVADLVSGKVKGVLILDPEKVGEVAVRVAQKVAPIRKRKTILPSMEEITQIAKACTQCKSCQRNCPQDYAIPAAMKAAAKGDLSLLEDLYETCIGCGRCEEACPQKIMIHSLIVKAGEKAMYAENNLCRSGRGQVSDVEIRNVGSPIVLGEIPGIVAIVGCSNYPKGGKDVYDMQENSQAEDTSLHYQAAQPCPQAATATATAKPSTKNSQADSKPAESSTRVHAYQTHTLQAQQSK